MFRPTLLPIDHWTLPDNGYATMRVTSPYAPRGSGFHAALDIGNARSGDVLVAADNATVYAVGNLSYPWSEPKPSDAWWNTLPLNSATGQRGGLYGPPSKWLGNFGGLMVILRSKPDEWLLYAHCETVEVSVNDRVHIGQRIGTVGDTGSSYRQDHLHFAVIHASEEQINALRARRRPIPDSMTVDPWPLIAASAGSTTLPDTALPEERDVYDWIPQIKHQIPKVAVVRKGAVPLKNPDGTPHSQSGSAPAYAFPADTQLEVIGGLPGYLWAARRIGGNGLFLVRNDDIAEWIKAPAVDCSAERSTIEAQADVIAEQKTALSSRNAAIDKAVSDLIAARKS